MKRGMGAYMGVAQGAVFPPKFIHLTYKLVWNCLFCWVGLGSGLVWSGLLYFRFV